MTNCLDSIPPVSLIGNECNRTGLTRAALLELAITERHAQRIAHVGKRLSLQVALMKEGFTTKTHNGWLRITDKGRSARRGERCRFGERTLSHAVRGECWQYGVSHGVGFTMCDARPLSWARVSGAVTSGRFYRLCA
jgi:hypothetical protein